MTRRDYVLVAKVIKTITVNRPEVTELFVREFVKDKPTFNADAFRKACGA